MNYVIAVFKSRNETLYLANMMMRAGVNVNVINTPREVGQACGISLQFQESLVSRVKQNIAMKPFKSFYGIFKIVKENGKTSIIRL